MKSQDISTLNAIPASLVASSHSSLWTIGLTFASLAVCNFAKDMVLFLEKIADYPRLALQY